MTHSDAAAALEVILVAENEALGRHDPEAAVALLQSKLVAADALVVEGASPEALARLNALAAENKRLLEIAIRVQGEIVSMLVRAAQSAAVETRYGAAGRTLRNETAVAVARQA